MSSVGKDKQLLQAVFDRKFDRVMAVLESGASVNVPPEAHWPPIVAATMVNHVGMVEYFPWQGADPDRAVATNHLSPSSGIADVGPGERALHIAARTGKTAIVRLLLKRSRADPNATDNEGCTPLMVTCSCPPVSVEVVRSLLEAGADPTMVDGLGLIPLHMAALYGSTHLVVMLYSNAPTTLNRRALNGATPLYVACKHGHENTVSRLLSLGAVQREPADKRDVCPLVVTVGEGLLGVARVLINEGGIGAVGGDTVLREALRVAVCFPRAGMLRLLLTAHGEDERSELANVIYEGQHLLHYGAGCCYPAAVSILLQAGADEAAPNSGGRIPRDVIGLRLSLEVQVDQGEAVAISRMLQRGPAYRARSWAWPSDEEVDACGSGEIGTNSAAVAAVLSPPQAVKSLPVIGVRIFRPKENSSSKFFVGLIGRYCAKD